MSHKKNNIILTIPEAVQLLRLHRIPASASTLWRDRKSGRLCMPDDKPGRKQIGRRIRIPLDCLEQTYGCQVSEEEIASVSPYYAHKWESWICSNPLTKNPRKTGGVKKVSPNTLSRQTTE